MKAFRVSLRIGIVPLFNRMYEQTATHRKPNAVFSTYWSFYGTLLCPWART